MLLSAPAWDGTKLYTAKNPKSKFEKNIPKKGFAQPQYQFPHSCVSELFIFSHNQSAYSAAGNIWPILGICKSLTVEIGTEVAQFPEKEYINGIFIAVYDAIFTLKVGKIAQQNR
jgi:hypothetical protein